ETLALRPKVGWAVREAEKMDVLLGRLAKDHTTFSGCREEKGYSPLPPDLRKFYDRTDGAELFGRGGAAAYRIVAKSDIEELDWGELSESLQENRTPNGQIWYRLCRLADGSYLTINPRPEYPEPWRKRYCEDPNSRQWTSFVAICNCRPETQGKPGQN